MNNDTLLVMAALVAALAAAGIALTIQVFYLKTLSTALARCSPANRSMPAGAVWLLLIPLFNFIWNFFVVTAISRSLHAEFAMRKMPVDPKPGFSVGMAMSILAVFVFIPWFGVLTGIAALICWASYWSSVAEYSQKISHSYRPGKRENAWTDPVEEWERAEAIKQGEYLGVSDPSAPEPQRQPKNIVVSLDSE